MQPSLPDDLISIAESYGVDLKYINFEVTETAAIPTEMLRHLMTTLISHGATFSVDDFGTGYSNIIRLANMPFSIIKIDKSILWNYFKTRDDLVPRIYEMLNIEGYNLVTEGVETDEMHLWLRDVAHCKYEQGYLYSKPIDEDNFKKYLSEHNCRPISAPVKKPSPAGESMAAM
ncbi:MAG: EAL domain-containing protein [Lachnospiraceae bacterium]|uniref:EAL domain-containing protein n=1 Tax=Candidatus Weimeria bifida TaxID=2599074 RepID=A0A6N7IZE2_9FIRM|nr:EAL domain-containing protein [Candidatus Weimeria bifida]RRF96635.1 MAG: EAL domain-containing protein [Lachnospiraceae bacterium]